MSNQALTLFMPVDYLEGFKDVGSRELDNELVVRFYEKE
jgi:hypothetical protein